MRDFFCLVQVCDGLCPSETANGLVTKIMGRFFLLLERLWPAKKMFSCLVVTKNNLITRNKGAIIVGVIGSLISAGLSFLGCLPARWSQIKAGQNKEPDGEKNERVRHKNFPYPTAQTVQVPEWIIERICGDRAKASQGTRHHQVSSSSTPTSKISSIGPSPTNFFAAAK